MQDQKALVFVVPHLLFFSLTFSSMCLRATKMSSWLAHPEMPWHSSVWLRKGRLLAQLLLPCRSCTQQGLGAVGGSSVWSVSVCYCSGRVGCAPCSHPTRVGGAQPPSVLIHSCPASPSGKPFPNGITNRNLDQTASKNEWAFSPKCFQTQIDFPALFFYIGFK